MHLDKFPLTPSGKLDRRALPAPEPDAYVTHGYQPPQGEMETRLAAIWAEVLKLDRVGRNDNFFELGGHSLLAIRVVTRLRQVLNIETAMRDVFAYPVLADLAGVLGAAASAELPPILQVGRNDQLPLSFAQQRLWFLSQMEGGSAAYHIPFGLRLVGPLDKVALGRALDRIIARHEALRTTFVFSGDSPEQRISLSEGSRFLLIEHDLREHDDAELELRRITDLEACQRFDLECGPLIRGRLVNLPGDEHALLLTMHHIVFDGWSMGVLVNELSALYGAFRCGAEDPLPELHIQYADYAVWQRQWIEGEILHRQAEYWKQTLSGAPALLELPTDYMRPVEKDYAGAFAGLVLDERLSFEWSAGPEPSSWHHTVHDASGGLGYFAGQVVGTAGCGDRHSDCQPRACRDRKPDRLFCKYPSTSSGSVWFTNDQRVAGAGKKAGAFRTAASGYPVRAGRRDSSTGTQSFPQPCISGSLYVAKHSTRTIFP